MTHCNEHGRLMIELAEIKADIKRINEKLDSDYKEIKEHVDESRSIRLDIHDNTKFRQGASKALWAIALTLIGIWIKLLF